jgi:hypothetical protein
VKFLCHSLKRTHSDFVFVILCATGKVWETVLATNDASFEGVYNANTEVKIFGNKLDTF